MCRLVSIVLLRDSDFQLRMQQTPFVGRASLGPAGGAHSAPPDPLAGLGRVPRKVCRSKGGINRQKQRRKGIYGKEGEETEGLSLIHI